MEDIAIETDIKRRKWCGSCRDHLNLGGVDLVGGHFQIPADIIGGDDFFKDYKRKLRDIRRKRGTFPRISGDEQCRNRELCGEVTVFLSLTFILLVSFVGAMMESASIQNAKNYRRADVNRAMECVFAEYQKELLEEYGVFALESSYETGVYDEEQIVDRLEFFGSTGIDYEIRRLQLLTDDGGGPFREQVMHYMENKYGVDKVQSLVGETDLWKSQDEKSETYHRDSEKQEQQLGQMLAESGNELPSENNPVSHMKSLQVMPLLGLVCPTEMTISEKRISLSDTVSHRMLHSGRGDFSDQVISDGTLSQLLFGEYVEERFASAAEAGGTQAEHALDYEFEYILMGKATDKENLEEVVKRLMLLRFVPNYGYLQTDAEMKAEAEALAGTLCAVLAVPAITEATAQMILLAWAYGECIMDLRTLLSGGRLPLVKSKESWKLSLSGLMKLGTEEDVRVQTSGVQETTEELSGETGKGMNYQTYLQMLLFLERKEAATFRVLDLIEQNLRIGRGLEFFRADACVSRMEVHSACRLRRGITYQFQTYFGYN